MDIIVADRNAHCVGGNGHSFDDAMRIVTKNVAVLESTRFAFVGVTNEVFLPGKLPGHEAPFQTGRKTCAATAAQRRLLDFGNDIFRRYTFGQYFAQSPVTAPDFVIIQGPVGTVQSCQNDRADMPVMNGCHGRKVSSSSSSFCSDMKLHIRWLLTSKTGASPHAP